MRKIGVNTKYVVLLFFIMYSVFFLMFLFGSLRRPTVRKRIIQTLIPHEVNPSGVETCEFQLRKMFIRNRPLMYYFEVIRHKDDELVFIFSPDIIPGRAFHNIALPKKSVVNFLKYKRDDPISHPKPILKSSSTCEEKRFTLHHGAETRFVGGVVPAMIYSCSIPAEFGRKIKSFHVSLDCDVGKDVYHVQDCRRKEGEKVLKYSANVITNAGNEEIVNWLKYANYIGIERVNLFLHNSSPSILSFFHRNYDPNFLKVIGVVGNHWKVLQTIVLADSVFRDPSTWVISNDVDEFPVFFPHLDGFIDSQPKDVSGVKISSIMFDSSGAYRDYTNTIGTMFRYSRVVKVVTDCSVEKMTFFEERAKPIFRPETVYNLENHYACPREGYKVYSSDFSQAFFAHYYERPNRYLPKPYKSGESYADKLEKIIWEEMGGCYYEMIDRKRTTGLKEVMVTYDDILSSCEGLLCEKNEMEMKDQRLIAAKNTFNIVTEKRTRQGYTSKQVKQYHESIIAHCRYTHETAKIHDFDDD